MQRISLVWLLILACCGTRLPIADAQSNQELEEQAFQAAAAVAEPSIVRIETIGGIDLVGDVLTGTGPTTGVIVGADGYIITSSFNFAANPATIIVTLPDEHQYAARVVAEDKSRLLTLLKIEASGLKPLMPVPRQEVNVGQWSIALGRTYDLKFPNISIGIISALNRIWGRAVQTDAKVSPVNYGGPLIDVHGRGIGILVPRSAQSKTTVAGMEWYDSGIGFAVPLDDIYQSLPRLKMGETLHAGLLGVGFEDDSALGGETRVITVRPESPADKAGILEGDIITAVNGLSVTRVPLLKQALGRYYAEDTVTLTLKRDATTLDVKATLAAELKAWQFPWLGILPKRAPDEPPEQGCRVRHVFPDSPAAQAGILTGDVIQSLNELPIQSRDELAAGVKRLLPGETVKVALNRQGQPQSVDVMLSGFPDSIPEEVPAVAIPNRDVNETVPATGRWNETLPGDGATFWGLVPESYNPSIPYGILLWLHPAGDTQEAEVAQALQEFAAQRGWIIVGLRAANLAGWTPEEEAVATGVIDWVKSRYRIDAARVVVGGHQEGADFAIKLAFKERELIRGALISEAAIRSAPPPNDPDFRLQLLLLCGPESPLHQPVLESLQGLRELKYPTSNLELSADQTLFSADVVVQWQRWLDAIDQL